MSQVRELMRDVQVQATHRLSSNSSFLQRRHYSYNEFPGLKEEFRGTRSAYAHEHCGSSAESRVRWPRVQVGREFRLRLAASSGWPRVQAGREFRLAASSGWPQVQAGREFRLAAYQMQEMNMVYLCTPSWQSTDPLLGKPLDKAKHLSNWERRPLQERYPGEHEG